MEQRKGKSPRGASLRTSKIIVDDIESKAKLIGIGSITGENMKETVARLVDAEFKKVVK